MRCNRGALCHTSCITLGVIMFIGFLPFVLYVLVSVFVHRTLCLCGDSIKWSHSVHMDDVFGLWYGIGYAQHHADRTDIPNEVGCVSLFITDVNEYEDTPFDWPIEPKSYSFKSNPWSDNAMSGSWLNFRLKRKVKRNINGQRRVRVLWDKDGRTMEQVYVYYDEEPGLWTADLLRPLEKEMLSRGIDLWYPDDPPRHPDVIRLLKLNPQMLILNHCSEAGNGGIFTLILRRSPTPVNRWEWYKYQQEFYKFDLPNVYRFFAICASCTEMSSFVVVLISFISLFVLC